MEALETNLFDEMLRERGYSPWLNDGFVSFLGVGMHNNTLVMLAGRRAEYLRGTPADPDTEVLPAMIFSTVKVQPLASVDFDIVDTVKRTVSRMDWIEGTVGTIIAFGAITGEGDLVGERLRQTSGSNSVFWLRTVSDTQRTRPEASSHGRFEISAQALISLFHARVESNQVLVDSQATRESRFVILNGMREAARPASAQEDALTRVLAWTTEIALSPLVSPCVRLG